jgi:hypothetical protein
MRAMRTEMKITLASMLALGVCVWVGETRADGLTGGDDIALGSGVGSSDLQSLNGGLQILNAQTQVTQGGTVDNNDIDNTGGTIETGAAVNNVFSTGGISLVASNTGMNALIQQTVTINVLFAPQN